jgi:hypothetical protein
MPGLAVIRGNDAPDFLRLRLFVHLFAALDQTPNEVANITLDFQRQS